MEKPSNFADYKGFLEEMLNIDMDSLQDYYERIVPQIFTEFCNSDFYNALNKELQIINDEYLQNKDFVVLDLNKSLIMHTKKFDDMLKKCYRYDVLYNEKWDSPDDSWCNNYNWSHPLNCFINLNDIIRTRIIIRYLDGINIVLDKCIELCEKYELNKEIEVIAEEKGYYGIHFIVKYPCEIRKFDIGTEEIVFRIEIQLCTQIKEIINELLHKYYEEYRMRLPITEEMWQWNYASKEFIPYYLGHIAHYVEGMVMEAREKINEV